MLFSLTGAMLLRASLLSAFVADWMVDKSGCHRARKIIKGKGSCILRDAQPMCNGWDIERSIHQPVLDWTSVATRLSIGGYIGWLSTSVSTDIPIQQYSWLFTNTSSMTLTLTFHWCQYFTDTSFVLQQYSTKCSSLSV